MLIPLSKLPLLPMPRDVQDAGGCLLAPKSVEPKTSAPRHPLPREGYRIRIMPDGVNIESSDPAGTFYARMTLRQIGRVCPGPWPCGVITDAPVFATRGVMIDISRDKVPTLTTLLDLIEQLAEWKINRIELYTEHTFAYRNHARVWCEASPMTPDDIRTLDQFCRECGIDLVPNQNSFGHVERWLKHPEYRHLAECPDGFTYPWGSRSPCGTTLDPDNPASIALVSELYDELLPVFSSPNINVGCDETWELGQGRSRERCERVGKGRVYLDFLLKIHALTARHNRRMHFWGDVILHHPELIPEIPRDSVALAWGYEANHPFETQCATFANSGIPFFVCPGTSSWLSFSGRTENCIHNLAAAASAGRRHGAQGYLITDWGDRGHWQYLPASFLGFALGAALAWDNQANAALVTDRQALCERLDRHAFHDTGHAGLARRFHDLGNVHLAVEAESVNNNVLFRTFNQHDLTDDGWGRLLRQFGPERFLAAEERLDALAGTPVTQSLQRPDASLIGEEFTQTAHMLRHACRRALMVLQHPAAPSPGAMREDVDAILAAHRRLWLARNRPGGLADSAGRMEARRAEYAALA